MKRNENRALWWQIPSFMDEPIGPWSRDLPQASHSRIQLWKRAIDWMAEYKITHFIGVIESPFKGARQSGCPDWPFHYVCHWPDHPHAQILPDEMLQTYRTRFRLILAYLQQKGIRTYLHHYNHFAPYAWYVQQTDLIEAKLEYGITREKALEPPPSDLRKGLCANAVSYRSFMQASWRELFHQLPELDGLLITLGEANYCPCKLCSGGVPWRERWDHILTPEWSGTMAKFACLFKDTLTDLGKQPMIRCYHGGGDRGLSPLMPKGVTYVIKYSGMNAIDCGPDPICHFWLNEGHDLWFLHELSGAENCSGGMWVNPEHSYNVVARANTKPVTGQLAYYNPYWGMQGMAYPGMELNLEAGLKAFNGEEYDQQEWIDICNERLGPRGEVYLQAGRLLSKAPLNIDKVASGSIDDGSCFMQHHHLTGPNRPPGVVGEPGLGGLEPHPWRSKLGPLRRIRERLVDVPWDDDIMQTAWHAGEENPLAFWDNCVDETLKGLEMIEALDVTEDDPCHSQHEVLLTAARWVGQFSKHWKGMLYARIYYWGANSLRTPLKIQQTLAQYCIECMQQVVDAQASLKALYYDFPVLYMNFAKPFSGATTVEQSFRHYQAILEKIVAEFEPLTSGRYYQWPDGGTWNWPGLKADYDIP